MFTIDTNLLINKTSDLYVLAKPVVQLSAMSLTIEKGSDVIISCSASVPGTQDPDPSTFKWFRWNGKVDMDISKEIGDSKSKRSTMIYN